MKKLLSVFMVFAVIFSFASCTVSQNEDVKADRVHAAVNGMKITGDEIEYFKNRIRADIINEYAEKYSITDFSGFWERDFDGRTPQDYLIEKSVREAAKAKLKLILMKDNGVYDDISFDGLKKRAEKYNAEHENAGGTVGIKTVDINTFYTYYISTGEMELKNILAETSLKPAADEIAEMTEKNPELTEDGAISSLVDEKYEKMISEMFGSMKIEIFAE